MDFKSKSNLMVFMYVKDHSGSMKNNYVGHGQEWKQGYQLGGGCRPGGADGGWR